VSRHPAQTLVALWRSGHCTGGKEVKGKGFMMTYLLDPTEVLHGLTTQTMAQNNLGLQNGYTDVFVFFRDLAAGPPTFQNNENKDVRCSCRRSLSRRKRLGGSGELM